MTKKNAMPLVSIIIPVYNGKNYLKEAIDSALAQTYKNIEILVINDGSTDCTEKIAKKYGDKIRYYKKENGGVSTALNLGIRKMKGKYFSWLSHDDLYMPNKILEQMKYISNFDDKTILFADYCLINKKSQFIRNVILNHEVFLEKPEKSILTGSINGITLLIPKRAFTDFGDFDVNLKCTQDYDMWLKMMKKYKFVHHKMIYTKTRIHSSQDTIKNPRTLSEGNILWKKIIDNFSDKRKIELDGSLYNYYNNAATFLENTSYSEAKIYAQDKARRIEKITKLNNKIKVTVIIPFYNRLELLKKSINSVLSQTYKNIELIIVDDASTVDVEEIKYICKKNNIKYFRLSKNSGPSTARNFGISKASGEYIAFLDSDDEFLEEKVEKQLYYMILNGSSFCHTSYTKVTLSNNQIQTQDVHSGKIHSEFSDYMIDNCQVATPTIMIKKSLLINNKIEYNTKLRIAEDNCFYLEICKHTFMFGLDECLTKINFFETSTFANSSLVYEGLKNILLYVLNDSYYYKYQIAIGRLCGSINHLLCSNDRKDFYESKTPTIIHKISEKFIYYYKTNGILKTIFWIIKYPFVKPFKIVSKKNDD